VTQLSLDDVVALNALIVTAIGLSLAFGRRGREQTKLNLSGPRRTTAYDEIPPEQRVNRLKTDFTADFVASSSRRRDSQDYGAAALKRLEEEEEKAPLHVSLNESRQLNVFFNWNGHTWDAFEVLGVPAGSGRDAVVQAFHSCRTKSPDSTAFLQAATDAILKPR
jgi:hypothetical protein